MGESKFKTYSVADFLGWQREGSLVLSPSFQRRPVWSQAARSLLMDSIVRSVPVPMVFLRDLPADLKTLQSKREVVDGQQRLRTILSFVDPASLRDFEESRDSFLVRPSHNKAISNKRFSELDDDYQRSILQYEISVYVFPYTTSDQEILQVFARLNSTGMKLNYQELRNAEFFGEFKTLAYELAAEQLERWRAWRVFSEGEIARMLEVELMSEFMQVAMSGVSAKSKPALDRLYRANDDSFAQAEAIAQRMRKTMDVMDDKFGRQLRSLASKQKTLVYGMFCATYDALYGLGTEPIDSRAAALPVQRAQHISDRLARVADGTAPDKVMEAIARRTTHKNERLALVNYLKD